MNLSINDPSGLQDSLANVSKQFTYFDESTKTFKINPQGVLTLREMEKEAGLTQGSLSKMGLAAAEADKRISAINEAGLTIVKEEDKQYLANIANMEGGTYKVTLEDGTKKELAELSQPEFEKLIEEQRSGPKTLEDLQKSQLTLTDVMNNNIQAIKERVVYGLVSPQTFLKGLEDVRGLVSKGGEEVSKLFDTKDVRELSSSLIKPLEDLMKTFSKNGSLSNEDFAKALDGLKSANDGVQSKVMNLIEKAGTKISDNSVYQKLMGKLGISTNTQTPQGGTKVNNVQSQQIKSLMYGKDGASKQLEDATTKNNMTSMTTKSTVDVGGKILVEFATTNGSELSKKILDDWANLPQTKKYFIDLVEPKDPTKAPR
jgi:hypothetical protein